MVLIAIRIINISAILVKMRLISQKFFIRKILKNFDFYIVKCVKLYILLVKVKIYRCNRKLSALRLI